MDPVLKYFESPYSTFSSNPLWFIDFFGDDTSNLTGSCNLMIFIQHNKASIDFEKMKNQSGDWDFVVVENIKGAENILKSYYGDKVGFIENMVVKSHGATSYGPDLDNAGSVGVIHNPSGNKSMEYIRSLLTKSANLCFTACSIVQGYNNPENTKPYKNSRETAKNYSEYFLKGTKRNMFMNHTISTSVGFTDADKDKILDDGEKYWFRFNLPLVIQKNQWSGFMWFYYNQNGTWLKQNNYYQIIVDTRGLFSEGSLKVSTIKPINPQQTAPNAEPPKKTDL